MRKFSKINIGKIIPQSFTDFCNRAKQSEEERISEEEIPTAVQLQDVSGYVITTKITELSGNHIKQVFKAFKGATLTINFLPKVRIYIFHH